MREKLTLLVFLKDRADFTERFVQYLTFIQYPFHIIFADGSIGKENEKICSSIGKKCFSFEYIRYPEDNTLLDYYQKGALAIEKVKTPYVMLVDNDDFPVVDGQIKAIEFLEENNDYIGCNGRVGGEILSPNANKPYGNHVLFLPYYCYSMDAKIALNNSEATMRIRSYLDNFYSIYYCIYRTENLKLCLKKIGELSFSELGIHELFFSYIQLAQGKIHTIDTLTYVRQKGSSQAAASQKDWIHRLFYTNWLSDLQAAIQCVAETIALNENKNAQEVYNILYEDFVARQRGRFMPTNFYLCVNPRLFFNKPFLLNAMLNKIFINFPRLGEFMGYCFFKKLTAKENLRNIRDVITSKKGW